MKQIIKDFLIGGIMGIFLFIIISIIITLSIPEHYNIADLFREYCECTIQTEYVLDDKTRVDIVTDTHAIEIDYASDFYAAIGQSLFYAEKTGLKPGILLQMGKDDKRFLDRLLIVAKKYKITVWILEGTAILLIYGGE